MISPAKSVLHLAFYSHIGNIEYTHKFADLRVHGWCDK